MASGTIYGSTGNQYIDSKIEWSSTANVSTNTSTVTATLYYKRNNSGYTTSGTGNFTIIMDDETHRASVFVDITKSDWISATSMSKTITHNDDGTKGIRISASGVIPGTTLTTTTCIGVATLDTIPRASTIASIPTPITLGKDACPVTWIPLSKSFVYTLELSIGARKLSFPKIHPNQVTEYTYTIESLDLDWASNLPNSSSGTMTATLYTYSDSDATVQVGSASSKTFSVIVPYDKAKPTISMTFEAVNPASVPDSFAGVYIQGKSRIKANIICDGKYGATVSYGLLVLNKWYTRPYLTEVLNTVGIVEVEAQCKDSRGFINGVQYVCNVNPYSNPKLIPSAGESDVICARCNEDGNFSNSGTYLRIKAKRDYSKVLSSDEQKNFCSIRYRYVEEGQQFSGDDGWITILEGEDTSTDTVDIKLFNGELKPEASYIVQVGVVDTLGGSDAEQYIVPTAFVTVDIPESHKGRRIGVFRYARDISESGIDFGAPIFGGSVDSLKLGTVLAATANAPIDLDDMSTPGCYYSPNKETTQYISNAPANVNFGFGLEIRELQSKENIRQTLYYGITTWYRHWNGSEWSAWVSSLAGVSDEVIAHDFVVDSGTSGLWKYRLWQSGEAELWGRITLASFSDERSIYCYAGLPFPFIEYPTVSMTISKAVEYGYTQGAIVLSEVYLTGTNVIRLYMIRDEGGLVSGNTATVSVTIKGRYK